jgi:glycosyltransferase involved in cell wall biosynthesis
MQAERSLVIAGIIQDREYFETSVEPHIDDERVTYLGPVGPDRRQSVLGNAAALLHLIDFEEPFGFSVVEAMACGTPVIAHNRGSMSEIIEPGVNGFLVSNRNDTVHAVEEARRLDRSAVRLSIEGRFDAARMVDDYLSLYRRLLDA